jgi:hypothetical protein
MKYFNDYYNSRYWHLSEEARELLDDAQLNVIHHTVENIDNRLDFENDLSFVAFWFDYTVINRLIYWLAQLNDARSYNSKAYTSLVSATLWAFKHYKPIGKQTQYQCEISITLLKDFLYSNIPIRKLDDAKYLLMNFFILSVRPDLGIRSLHKEMATYHNIEETNNVFKKGYDELIHYLFVKTSVPSFLFPHLINCSDLEHEIIVKLLEGKSLRKTLPTHFNLTKSENSILQNNSIKLTDIDDHHLERYVLAARILKEISDDYMILNTMLRLSKIFKDQFATFKNDLVFWKSVFRFLSRNKNTFSNNHNLSHYIDFFESQRYFSEPPLKYNLKGRTFASVERAVDNWIIDYSFNPKYLEYSWEPLPIENWHSKDSSFSYIIEEITDGTRLLKESKTLNHCVISYAESCRNGSIHIFSLSKLRKNVKNPFITIEVRKNVIVQIAGKMNETPNNKVMSLIRSWSTENDLILGARFKSHDVD